VLVFQFDALEPGVSLTADFSMAAQQAAGLRSLRVMMRPGLDGICAGWLWLFGVPHDTTFVPHVRGAEATVMNSFSEALDTILDVDSSPAATSLRLATDALQNKIGPGKVQAKLVTTEYYTSDRSVCDLGIMDETLSQKPMVLLGDALCGKPFYTGANLNTHLKLVTSLIDDIEWSHDGLPLTCNRFYSHERQYQADIMRTVQFERGLNKPVQTTSTAQPQSVSPPPPPAVEHPMSPQRQQQQQQMRMASTAVWAPGHRTSISLKAPTPLLSKSISLPKLGGGSWLKDVPSPSSPMGIAASVLDVPSSAVRLVE